ncbi:conserved hypothetical protein [Methylocella tundrae]|uniref:DUF2380 domain-containing protein n=1 Tax=Methylocella tundrae TaxID=227605 RepID=A0A8B6M8Y0_METTU|nr:DUF3280 domain-containing protein [Methylocella tundrae]VTZ51247.1 conserved hypothetical protein [Methylocella tundrae]
MMGHEIKSASKITPDAQDRSHHRRRELFHMRRRAPFAAFGIMALLLLMSIVVGGSIIAAAPTPSAPVKSVAFLGVQFINDNEGQEPTTDAERARLASIEELFKSKLEASGRYKFIPMPAEIKAKIAAGSPIGQCGGCGIDYGKQLGGDLIAWVVVQKVSNLILNINVYMADVATKKMTFVHSVDIRGNTDESWTRGMTYMVRNYVLTNPL